MKTYLHSIYYLAQFFSEWEIFKSWRENWNKCFVFTAF